MAVVDDSVETRRLVEGCLRDLGCAVKFVAKGREAPGILRRARVDLVITEILMQDVDGLEVIKELKRVQPSTRIVAMSGRGTYLRPVECLKWARSFGADAVIRSHSVAKSS